MRFLRAQDKPDRHRGTRFLLSVGMLKIRILRTFSKDLKSKSKVDYTPAVVPVRLYRYDLRRWSHRTIYICENAGNIPNPNERRPKFPGVIASFRHTTRPVVRLFN